MATSRLALYNIALAKVGERSVASTDEGREPTRLLNEIWDRGQGAQVYWLEQGLWNWAVIETSSTASSTGNFNFQWIHDRPTDYVRLAAISADQTFYNPLTRYEMQSTNIMTDISPVYLRYVSKSTTAGLDMEKWPETFTLWAGYWLALQIAPRIPNMSENDKELLRDEVRNLLYDARSKDAQDEPTRWPPLSSWAQARLSRGWSGRERGLPRN